LLISLLVNWVGEHSSYSLFLIKLLLIWCFEKSLERQDWVKHNENLMKKLLFLPFSIKSKMPGVAKQMSPTKIQEKKKVHTASLGIHSHINMILYFLGGIIWTIWYWSWKHILSKWFEQTENVCSRRYKSRSLWNCKIIPVCNHKKINA